MSRSYYALVAGLPDLIMDDTRLHYARQEFKRDLEDLLYPEDLKVMDPFFNQFDNSNLMKLLRKEEGELDLLGKFSKEELDEEIKTPTLLPEYMIRFLEAFQNSAAIFAGLSWEDQLSALFYEAQLESDNRFVSEWFSFEQNLRNVLVGLNCRSAGMDVETKLVGENYVVDSIKKSNTGDFGLSKELSYLDKVLHIYSVDSLVERERDLDILRWEYVDELTTFDYFTIEKIAGFWVKLGIAERWLGLDYETGRDMFRKILEELRSGFTFPDEFRLSGGRKHGDNR